MKLAQDMQRNPDWYMGGLDSNYEGENEGDRDRGDGPTPAYGNPAIGEDPNAAARQQQYKDKERAEDASAPMDEARGEDAGGNGTSGRE